MSNTTRSVLSRRAHVAAAAAMSVSLAACSGDALTAVPQGGAPSLSVSTASQASAGGIVPVTFAGNTTDGIVSGDNMFGAACDRAFTTTGSTGFKVDEPSLGSGLPFGVGATYGSTGSALDWAANPGYTVIGVLVKGSTGYNAYAYAGTGRLSDAGLVAPFTRSGRQADISHIVACTVAGGGGGGGGGGGDPIPF